MNDITRFWKTLCLNYEAFSAKTDLPSLRLDNIKLRFSRKLTCFSTVIAVLGHLRTQATASKVLDTVLVSPWQRIYDACGEVEGSESIADSMAESYLKFLDVTDRAKKVENLLQDEVEWSNIKEQSETFATGLVELISKIGPADVMQLVAL